MSIQAHTTLAQVGQGEGGGGHLPTQLNLPPPLSPVRNQLVALLARSVSIVTGPQPIEQLEGYDVIG